MNKGYTQSIENLAFTIDNLAQQSMDPLILEHGMLSTEEASELMSQEELQQWEQVEIISQMICETYNISYDTLMADTSAVLMENLIACMNGVQ